ncbi:MAG: translation initiation factor IF-2 [Myxococcota bacterium]
MAKIRAYKLAEELGIDRVEFVERAAAVGVPLKSAMASLEPEEVERLRRKLGGVKTRKRLVTDQRVERKDGAAVIRRRRKAVPEPPPEPAPAEELQPEALPPPPESVVEPAELAPVQPPPEASAPGSAPAAAHKAAAGREAARDQAPADRAGKQRKLVREVVNLREQERLARQAMGRSPLRRQVTLDPRSVSSPRRRRRDAPAVKPVAAASPKEVKRVVRVEGFVSVGELARMLGAKSPEVQRKLMALGTMVSINQAIDVDMARKVSAEFGFEVQDVGFREDEFLAGVPDGDEAKPEPRPPVITVMGHVDHGKTSLLDALRQTDVVSGEAGGITQHIGAYQLAVGGKQLTFIDTPGHEAFTMMRARGAQVTDIVILVIAASEGVMPQTVEAIDHAKAAGVPIVVAVNKCDLPGANPQQTRQRLMEHGLVPEEFGGETICVDVSATKGTGLEKLLEMVSLQADLLELKADPNQRGSGVVLEARLDKGRGPVATVLVQQGTLKRGDTIVCGALTGRVRALLDENNQRLDQATPSVPVQVIGFPEVPEAGQPMHAVENERVGRQIVEHRLERQRGRPAEGPTRLSLDEFFTRAEGGGVKELPLVVKGDVQGSVEALRDALFKLSTDAVKVSVIHSGVGAVTESDVMLAKACGAIIVAFHVRPEPAAGRAAEGQGVDVRVYQVIYELTDDVKKAMVGLLPPTVREKIVGRAEVRRTFNVPRAGTVAGSYVTEGNVRRGGLCRLLRDGVQIYEGKVGSLKRFKDDTREVAAGFECGIGIDGYNDVKVGDVIEAYALEEEPATL